MDTSRRGDRGAEPQAAAATVDRRRFMVSGAFAFVAVSGGASWIAAAAEGSFAFDAESFRTLSRYLTGATELDPILAQRALAQLGALEAQFPASAAALGDAVRKSGAASVDGFLSDPASSDSALRETMGTIVSAWYLGYTGTPISLRAEDDTGFVTFTGALMYEPTMDATVRPTYARAGLNYWVEPPPFVAAPPMPSAMKLWGRESPQGVGRIPVTPAPPGEEPMPLSPRGAGP